MIRGEKFAENTNEQVQTMSEDVYTSVSYCLWLRPSITDDVNVQISISTCIPRNALGIPNEADVWVTFVVYNV